MAGLLTFPDSGSLPVPINRGSGKGVAKNTTAELQPGITAAGTVPDFHRIPYTIKFEQR